MRYIQRGDAPPDFLRFLEEWPKDVKLTWRSFQNPEKNSVKESLIKGQHNLCCYCECEISIDNSHIEHLSPRSKDDTRVIDYDNFAASCLRETEKGAPLTCGKARNNWNDPRLYLNPYDPACKDKVTFGLSGRILEDEYSEFVTRLRLNSPLKVEARLRAVEFLDDPSSEGMDEDDIKEYLMAKLLQGNYPEFISFILYYAKENYGIELDL